jgi:hypothetical protein
LYFIYLFWSYQQEILIKIKVKGVFTTSWGGEKGGWGGEIAVACGINSA